MQVENRGEQRESLLELLTHTHTHTIPQCVKRAGKRGAHRSLKFEDAHTHTLLPLLALLALMLFAESC